jgi:ribosomal protein L37AE/L43A
VKDVVSVPDQAPLVSRLIPAESAHHASQGAPPITAACLATDSRRLAEDVIVNCTQCGHKLPGDAWSCTECGSFQGEPVANPESSDLATGSAETPTSQQITVVRLATDSRRLVEDLTVSCTQCGHKLHRDAWFCMECGSFQSEPAANPESSDLATRIAETPTQQPITVAALPTDLPRRGPIGMTSALRRLFSIVSRSVVLARRRLVDGETPRATPSPLISTSGADAAREDPRCRSRATRASPVPEQESG